MNECTKCKRPGCDAGSNDPEANAECDGYVMGYRRGLADGVALAKEHIELDYGNGYILIADFVWTYVDAALEEAMR